MATKKKVEISPTNSRVFGFKSYLFETVFEMLVSAEILARQNIIQKNVLFFLQNIYYNTRLYRLAFSFFTWRYAL